MKPRRTKHNPHIYFANSENDCKEGLETNCSGLSAGFLNTKNLTPQQRNIWQKIFDSNWEHVCYSFATDLYQMGIEIFAIVPCSRIDVVEGIRKGFTKAGILEMENLIRKTNSDVSYAGKDMKYITENTIVDYQIIKKKEAKRIAICDDYSDSGKTLLGLYSTIINRIYANEIEVFLCSIGISKALEDGK